MHYNCGHPSVDSRHSYTCSLATTCLRKHWPGKLNIHLGAFHKLHNYKSGNTLMFNSEYFGQKIQSFLLVILKKGDVWVKRPTNWGTYSMNNTIVFGMYIFTFIHT